MAYTPDIVHLPADHWISRAGQKPVAIVVHGTGGVDSRGTLQHGDGRGVSIHVLIDKHGRMYRMVPDDRGANHAGAITSKFTLNGITYISGQVNKATLGIELENLQDGRDSYTDQQLQALGWLIADWRRQYGPLPILRHADLDPTRRRDPYQLTVQQIERYVAAAAAPAAAPAGLSPKRYRVKRVLISQRQEGGAPYAGELAPGDEVTIDHWYTNGKVHLQDGRGFVDLADLEPV